MQLKITKASDYRDMRDYILLHDTLWLKQICDIIDKEKDTSNVH